MAKKYERYEHHGNMVHVRTDLKGKHRDFCLCHSCVKLHVEDRDANCGIANELYDLCVEHGLATPVFECTEFVRDPEA